MSQATATAPGEALSGREAALARRRALSLNGKSATTGAKSGAPKSAPMSATEARLAARSASAPIASTPSAATPASSPSTDAASCGCQHGESISARVEDARPAAASSFTPTPISAARQRRMEQSLKGRGDAAPCRPCGRVRPEPPKVEIGTTLAGSTVTGNQVERTSRVTGNEAGTCRTITGTEYVGAEQFGKFCGTLPPAAPAKVGSTSTSRGGRVTGTEVGRSSKVTGDEHGTCKRVTGSEYLAAEQVGEFCGTAPEPRPEKVDTGMTEKRQLITGSDLNRKTRVTGTEPGAQRAITGSAYADASAMRNAGGDAPKKVETSHTSAGATVSGTRVGRSPSLTGVEQGSCKRVTGTDYIASEEFVSFCREQPYQSPAKVGLSRTLKGQDVSGTQVGRSTKVTGDEYGSCKPVTGSSYIGAEQYAEFCASRTAAEAINRARQGRSAALTGIQPGPDSKMTGNERGECQPISGTPYMGEDQSAQACGTTPAPTLPSDFSIATPARTARDSETRRITGSAYGDSGRITGPMARAMGLISGTPEFRYKDEPVSKPVAAPAPAAPERITGEGRERRITGDAWDRGDRITGTEGRSAQRRNPTIRGDARGNGVTARDNREVERPAPATSRITGSSGNTNAGPTITVSGGARG
jgi:hypothetical protein